MIRTLQFGVWGQIIINSCLVHTMRSWLVLRCVLVMYIRNRKKSVSECVSEIYDFPLYNSFAHRSLVQIGPIVRRLSVSTIVPISMVINSGIHKKKFLEHFASK